MPENNERRSNDTLKTVLAFLQALAVIVAPIILAYITLEADKRAYERSVEATKDRLEVKSKLDEATKDRKEVKTKLEQSTIVADNVKEALIETSIKADEKLETIHSLVNSNFGAQLKVSMLALKRVYELTKNPMDEEAYLLAKQALEEHLQAK